MQPRLRLTFARIRLIALGLTLAALLASCGRGEKQAAAAPPPPAVTVEQPVQQTVTDHDEYVGRFAAVNSVEMRARVSGYLDSIHFNDGQVVKKGDLLFTIDKRPFQYTLDQARANLATAKSNLAYAKADYQRGQSLVTQKTITQQVFEQRTQTLRNAEAAMNGAQAAVEQAQLDLEFTELRAPIDGRIGAHQVSVGNLVTGGTAGNTTLLATIVSTDPIYFDFTFDEASYLHYQRLAKDGNAVAGRGGGVPVSLKLIDEKGFVHPGRMDFVNNIISPSTDTILARAIFQNRDGLFTPGMFGRVRVPASSPYEALLVPDAAIASEQVRKYVLTVDGKDTVRQKYVTLGQLVGKLRVIKTGIAPTDQVVVEGLARIHVGQKVKPQTKQAVPNKPMAKAGLPSRNTD